MDKYILPKKQIIRCERCNIMDNYILPKKQIIRCERCNEILKPERVVWLELSMTDGKYYKNIPEGHESQGGFTFGSVCSKQQLKETLSNT